MATAALDRPSTENHFRLGLLFALTSALAFGSSGPFAKALIEAGWSPTGAVTARLAGGALAMAIVASFVRPGWVGESIRHAKTVIAYGYPSTVEKDEMRAERITVDGKTVEMR